MTGKASSRVAILERQGKVREYIEEGLREVTIAKMLGVSYPTILRDVRCIWAEMRKEAIAEPMESFADTWNKRWRKRREIAQHELINARSPTHYDAKRVTVLLRLIEEMEKNYIEMNMKFGRAPRVAEKMDMVQHVDNPLAGLTWDDATNTIVDERPDKQSK